MFIAEDEFGLVDQLAAFLPHRLAFTSFQRIRSD
jgi:hypothetical protein